MIERLLALLRGISGVDGALIATRSGVIIASDFNPLYTMDLLEAVLRGLGYLFQGVPEHLGEYEDAVLEYEERVLFARQKDGFLVVALALPHAEIDSLRVACNLLIAHIKRAQIEGGREREAFPTTPAKSAATAKAQTPPAQAHAAKTPVIKKKTAIQTPLSQRIKR